MTDCVLPLRAQRSEEILVARQKAVAISSKRAKEFGIATAVVPPCHDSQVT